MNDYNGPLPKAPKGFKNWRDVFSIYLPLIANHAPVNHADLIVEIVRDSGTRPPKEADIVRMPYATLAHYAAREQSEALPPLSFEDLHALHITCWRGMGPRLPERVAAWLQKSMEVAFKEERESD